MNISYLVILVVLVAIALNPGISHAKGGGGQNQIILLNDSAAALEDSDPALSNKLTRLADKKEKEWEDQNANKGTPPSPINHENSEQLLEQIKILKAAGRAIQPVYPLIAKGLDQMAKDIDRTTKIEK